MDNTIKSTTDYDKFSFLNANRELNRGHIENIKKAFTERGNFTQVQPILVSTDFKIIDGQHRFVAAKEVKQPVFYTVVEGLSVDDARQMNILHRRWHIEDYVKSYAEAGNRAYQRLIQLSEDYGLPYSVVLFATQDSTSKGLYKSIRQGELALPAIDLPKIRVRLARIKEIADAIKLTKPMVIALLNVMRAEGYSHGKMKRKLVANAAEVKTFANVVDNMAQLEHFYNKGSFQSNRVRLY